MQRKRGYIYEAHNYERGLGLATIQREAPAVFSTSKAPERKDSFAHLGTWELFSPLRELNYVPVQVMQSGARDPNGLVYARNLVRFRAVSDLGSREPEVLELVVTNADNGTTAFDVRLGYHVHICTNECVFGTFVLSLHIQHRRGWLDDAVNGVMHLARQTVTVQEVIEDYKSITLDYDQQLLLAQYVQDNRWGTRTYADGTLWQNPHTAEELLVPRHRNDNSLFGVGQDIQHHLLQGGDTAQVEGHRASTTRPVHAVRDIVRLNILVSDAIEIQRRAVRDLPMDAIIDTTATVL